MGKAKPVAELAAVPVVILCGGLGGRRRDTVPPTGAYGRLQDGGEEMG